jgi:hypothetical protein
MPQHAHRVKHTRDKFLRDIDREAQVNMSEQITIASLRVAKVLYD